MISNRIYLDYAATTPLDQRVLASMLPWLSQDHPGNAHSPHHTHGSVAHQAVQKARRQIAAAIGANAEDIVFTSGATEANNLALQGLKKYLKETGRTHIITSAVEHKSILATLVALESEGFRVSVLPVKPCAMIEADSILRAIMEQTGLVSIQAVNNETGTIQPLAEISAMLKGRGILFHVDAAQALGKIPFSIQESGADFVTLSAHKIYGPQGIGAACVRPGLLQAMQHGGGQERGLRPGTLSVALCAGFGEACALIDDERVRLQSLRDQFLSRIENLSPIVHGHSDSAWNVPGILNLRFSGIDQEALVMALPNLSFGTGAACLDGESHVIRAIGGSGQAAREAIRLSFGRFTTEQNLISAAEQLVSAVQNIRQFQEAA